MFKNAKKTQLIERFVYILFFRSCIHQGNIFFTRKILHHCSFWSYLRFYGRIVSNRLPRRSNGFLLNLRSPGWRCFSIFGSSCNTLTNCLFHLLRTLYILSNWRNIGENHWSDITVHHFRLHKFDGWYFVPATSGNKRAAPTDQHERSYWNGKVFGFSCIIRI